MGRSTKGDRVAILSENRPEWSTADFAILLLGAVTVPVYATLTPEQTAYTLRDSGASIIFVSTEHQLRKVQSILSQTQVQRIVIMDHMQIPGDLATTCLPMDQFMTQGPARSILKSNPSPAPSSPTTLPLSSTPPAQPERPRARC